MKSLTIEKQVCSLEQAKELAELLGDDAPGSLWMWCKYPSDGWMSTLTDEAYGFLMGMNEGYYAYTGDELGVLLPYESHDFFIEFSKDFEEYRASYLRLGDDIFQSERGLTEAQAKAALAIRGIKEGWIKKEDFKFDQNRG